MHPVLEHILARKGKSVPVDDGRKIVLVLFGGVMSSARCSGVLAGLHELGFQDCFDEIYTFSSGFPNAMYFLDGKSQDIAEVFANKLSGKKFINLWRFWNMVDIDYLLLLKDFCPMNLEKVLKHPTSVFVRLKDRFKGHPQFMRVQDYSAQEFYSLLRASVTMPYYTPGWVTVRGRQYKDDKSYRKSFIQEILAADGFTDILIVYNRPDQVYKGPLDKNKVFEILPGGGTRLGGLETRREVLLKEAKQAREITKKIFTENVSRSADTLFSPAVESFGP